ncbi:SPOSA6832_00890 [Sporobolomyces salmonicolor]|uniref:SPOSA6832_00890-mRNA-1:cds n=1 Tax=Sporidiobolus salmonicolor TaxID=5005 RepID=A0A0D6EHV8_SPOSA|nr:SPOSA6832_00890 [Sporobolomyces salmonicolor]
MHASTSRTSLDDLAAQDKRSSLERRTGKQDKALEGVQRAGSASTPSASATGRRANLRKGKGRQWDVELAVVGADGTATSVKRGGDSDSEGSAWDDDDDSCSSDGSKPTVSLGPSTSIASHAPSAPSSPKLSKNPVLFSLAGEGGIEHDPTSTFRSWKSSITGRRSRNIDKKRLAALGFEEELHRDYDFWASFGVSLCNIGGLPGTVLGVLTALETGGGSMYAIFWPVSGLFMCCLAAVLGEMASTWPVAGAMFTWVFRLCRSKKSLDPWARYASWVTGSLLLCSHVLLQIVITWQFAHNLLGIVSIYTRNEYSFWVTGILIVAALVNSSRLSRSPWLWRCGGFLIIAFWIVINVTLLTQSKEIRYITFGTVYSDTKLTGARNFSSAKFVFTSYSNSTGFESKSYVYMLGWVLTCVATGMEASAHMAEDTKKPSRTVPLAMFWSVAATYLMGWVSICVLLATVDNVGLRPDLQPSISLIDNSVPRRYTTLILVLVLLSIVFQHVAQLLATSRFIWALSRESALPFSTFFRRLSSKHKQPLQAIWAVVGISVPALLLLAVNTSIIATTLLEGAGVTVVASWVTPIVLYLTCSRDVLRGDGRAKWTLRKASKSLAFCAALFCGVFLVMVCLPTGWPVTSLSVSYAAAVWLGVLILSSLAWVLYGNKHYSGPIKTTTRWTIGAEIDLPSSSSHGGTKKKSAAAQAHITTSAEHGRSAHVFEETEDTEMTGSSRVTGTSRSASATEMGTDWTEYTDDDDGEDEDEDVDEDGDEEEEEQGPRSEPSPDRSRGRSRGRGSAV